MGGLAEIHRCYVLGQMPGRLFSTDETSRMLSLQEIAALLHSDKDEVICAIRTQERQLKEGSQELETAVSTIVERIRRCCEAK